MDDWSTAMRIHGLGGPRKVMEEQHPAEEVYLNYCIRRLGWMYKANREKIL